MPISSHGRTILQVAMSAATGANRDLIAAPGAGTRIYVVQIVFSMSATGTIKFTEGTGPTDLTGTMDVTAGGGFVSIGDGDRVVLATLTPNVKLGCTPVTGNANGWIRYFIDA